MQLPGVGETFEGRYELAQVLGRGGFAIVFRARDTVMSRDVALKILAPSEDYSGQMTKRFLREARVFAELEDPHTITMYDAGESSTGMLYMVFEYVRGEDLVSVVRRGPVKPQIVAHILTQLLSALREAHGRGIYHRDIKPANVLVYEYGGDKWRVKLIDFGIAKDANPHAVSLTRTGRIVGTPRYMAPEQLFGQPVGPDSDLYSLGLVAFELLLGRPAVDGKSNEEIIRSQVSDEPLLLPPQAASPEFRALIERMLARERTARFQSADAVLRELRELQRAQRIRAVEVADLDTIADAPLDTWDTTTHETPGVDVSAVRPPAPPRRVPGWVWGCVGGVMAGLVLAIALVPREEPPPPPPRSAVSSTPLTRIYASPTPEEAPPPVAPDVSAAVVAVDAGSSACSGRDPGWRGRRKLQSGFEGRPLFAYLPPSYDPTTPHPVVLMFHRSWVDARRMLDESVFEEVAGPRGFVLLAFHSPDSLPWGEPRDADYVFAALDYSFAEFCLDRSRVFAVGEGSGAAFAERLACAYPLSGLAMTGYAEAHKDQPCVPPTPTPRLRIYGTHDAHVPADGSDSCIPLWGRYRPATEIDRVWRDKYSCSGRQRGWGTYTGGACRTWSCDFAPLVTCAANGDHYWPTATPVAVDFFPSCTEAERPEGPGFEYRRAIWDFIEKEGRVVPSSETAH